MSKLPFIMMKGIQGHMVFENQSIWACAVSIYFACASKQITLIC